MKDLQAQRMQDSSAIVYESDSIRSGAFSTAGYYPSDKLPIENWRYEYVKRVLDILCAAMMLLVFAIPGLLIAAAILLSSEGGVFYHEERVGRGGRPFQIWKFRSMRRHDAQTGHIVMVPPEGTPVHRRMCKHLKDPRITPIGEFLRRWSLDELPQLLNILRGDMSLIGPRPIVKAETKLYRNLLSFYLSAKPGLSGLWQISGRSKIGYEDRATLDATYVQSWSLRRDLVILLKTIPAVLNRDGAQ